ncbi:13103_t:CDS:2 [Acaulospora morrowiae]|uniref:Dihydrofolate reductase n=1 Tax=Acaulospora morrowiae TaxID=94023 RepID=A0A9N9ECG1_9GLOM|nr:13103_t:CDS:2 [Acaulospora morrowiae]
MSLLAPPNFALIAAACNNWGIGINNKLPWKLEREMGYFERVTKHVVPIPKDKDDSSSSDVQATILDQKSQNVVIMGRKTWESIPSKYRPLKDRLNVVISRSMVKDESVSGNGTYLIYSTLDDAIKDIVNKPSISRIFIMGGSFVYKEAIESPLCKYILLTRVYKDFNCDTFFPEIDESVYRLTTHEELENFVGEKVPKGRQLENGIEYEFTMYERK